MAARYAFDSKGSRRTGRSMIGIVLLMSLAAAAPAPTRHASLSVRQEQVIGRYAGDLDRLKSGRSDVSVEQVFADAVRLHDALVNPMNGEPEFEQLATSEFEALKRRLPGMLLNREEVILAEPVPGFFQQLAAQYGDAIDRKFFALYNATRPDGVWPVYIEQQTDYSGCTDFGEDRLAGTYERWTAFRKSHPGRYRAPADAVIDDVEQNLTSTCACGDRESVLRELQDFASRFPESRVHAAVVRQIRELTAGKVAVRFNCVSG